MVSSGGEVRIRSANSINPLSSPADSSGFVTVPSGSVISPNPPQGMSSMSLIPVPMDIAGLTATSLVEDGPLRNPVHEPQESSTRQWSTSGSALRILPCDGLRRHVKRGSLKSDLGYASPVFHSDGKRPCFLPFGVVVRQNANWYGKRPRSCSKEPRYD
jgi:hypothetical protein